MNAAPFSLDGLTSRSGLSSWVLFFHPGSVVLVDLGVMAALKAGAMAGLLAQFPSTVEPAWGPTRPGAKPLADWCDELRLKAKTVEVLQREQVRSLRLHLRMMQHQLFLAESSGAERCFTFMNRAQAGVAGRLLGAWLGDGLTVSKTPVFGFLERVAPFLVS